MNSTIAFVSLAAISLACVARGGEHWNQFRGPSGDGVVVAKDLPVEFDEKNNVRWKTAISGEGWSSPVVWDSEVWLTTGSDEKEELRAICVNLHNGRITKNIKVFDMNERKVDPAYAFDSPHLNSPATPTPVVEEDHVFVSFGSQGIACLNRKTGDKVWERRDLRIYQPVRQGSSPVVDGDNLYLAYDGTDQQFFIALDKATGETRWKKDRNIKTDWAATLRASGITPGKTNGKPGDNKKSFATATMITAAGRRQVIASAAEAVISYDPATGKELWRVMYPGGFNVSARPVYANGLVYIFTSGLKRLLMAIKPGGVGDVTKTHVAWSTTRSTPGIPSPVIVDGLLFMVTSNGGVASCLDAVSGEEIWKKRLGGNHWASPVLAGGKLYFISKDGHVTVVEATKARAGVLARNHLQGGFIASPAIAGSNLLLRSTTHLYCVSKGFQRSDAEIRSEMKKQPPAEAGIDWDAAYEKLLKSAPAVRKKVESGNATKEQVVAWLKQKSGKGAKPATKEKEGKAAGNGVVNFYAIVIGRLRTKDIELGEFTLEVDHVSSMYANRWVKDKIGGKTVKVTGVAGQFLDNLLQIKRGATLKFRSGSYIPASNTLTFGPKFHVLERAAPFKPEDFGVPPKEFRGFHGELTGKIVDAAGYEVLLQVSGYKPASSSKAAKPGSITGRRVRIVGFYNQHAKLFPDLHEGDKIRVSVAHPDPSHDELKVTGTLQRTGK